MLHFTYGFNKYIFIKRVRSANPTTRINTSQKPAKQCCAVIGCIVDDWQPLRIDGCRGSARWLIQPWLILLSHLVTKQSCSHWEEHVNEIRWATKQRDFLSRVFPVLTSHRLAVMPRSIAIGERAGCWLQAIPNVKTQLIFVAETGEDEKTWQQIKHLMLAEDSSFKRATAWR